VVGGTSIFNRGQFSSLMICSDTNYPIPERTTLPITKFSGLVDRHIEWSRCRMCRWSMGEVNFR